MITPQQMEAYKKTAVVREAWRKEALDDRRRQAWEVAQKAAQFLYQNYGASRVILFGSLAHGYWFHQRSDIDLAVEGISFSTFFRAWAALDSMSSGFEVNLVALEDATERLLAEIAVYGVEL